jgi:hypothetical protein
VIARTPSAAAAHSTARRSASLLCVLAAAALLGVVTAAPAAAVDDPSKPDARVTNGPSCHPGGVVVEVTGGTVAYAVTLATTRSPQGEDSAEVAPGDTVVLRTGDVAWAETIDGRLEYVALDGSGATFVDELAGYTFTRPAEEDCSAIVAPAAPATVPPVVPGHEGAAIPTESGTDDVRPDGSRPGGSDAPAGTATPEPDRVIVQGSATPVELVETAASPAAVSGVSAGPLLVAAVALVAAVGGLAAELGRLCRARGRSTGRA